MWRLHPMWPFMTRTRSSSSSSCLHTLLLPQFGLCLVYMPHAARYQFSAMSPTLQVELQLQIPPASNGCQTAARQGGLGQAGRGGCCLGVHTIEVVHLAGVAACAPAPTPTPPHPPLLPFICAFPDIMADAAKQSKEDVMKTSYPFPCCPHTYINVFPNCELLLPLARFTPILAFFGSSQTTPLPPAAAIATWKNLLRLIVLTLALSRSLSLSLCQQTCPCTVRMCRGCS